MTTIRTLLVDDEQPARERLRRLLAGSADVAIVGEAEDGERALELILETRPDLVLLDIQMPGCTGMEVAASLPSPRPHVVFCTAFDQYAVDAFELHAVDYLLKPVNQTRLEKALERVRAGRATDPAIDRAARSSPPTRFVAQRGRAYRVVPARDVLCFLSEDGLTKLQTAADHYWPQKQAALDHPLFVSCGSLIPATPAGRPAPDRACVSLSPFLLFDLLRDFVPPW